MATPIRKPAKVQAAGQPPKTIEEFIGRVNSATQDLSIARMTSPSGWVEPGQRPQFDEYSVVLRGALHLKLEHESLVIEAGQAVIVPAGDWVQYSTPGPEGAEYIAVCQPAFAPRLVNRDPSSE